MFHEIIQNISKLPINNILTISMIVLLALSVLIGMIRGVRKSLFFTIFYILACVIFFFSLNNLTNIVLYADLSSYNFNVGDIHITSLGKSVPEILRVYLSSLNDADLSGLFIKGTESYTLVMALLSFAIQLVLCLSFIIVFQIAYKIVVWLIWLIIGKRFLKTKKRVHGRIIRKKKHEILGGAIGLIPGLMSVLMLFIPVSGIFSIASSLTSLENNKSVSFGEYLSEEDYELLQKAVGSYEESTPGQLFNLVTSSDGRSVELWLFDKMITVEIDNQQFNIRKDLEGLGQFAVNIASTGLIDVVLDDNFTTLELINVVENNEEIINEAFESLGDVELIDLVLNTGVEYLDKSRIVNDKLELSTDSINYENLSKLDWSTEFAQIGNILMSAVDVLKLLPETDLKNPVIDINNINIDVLNNDLVLENFVNELFKSNLINEASTAGLEYVMGINQVEEIVGEINKDSLKDIDLKSDLLKVVSAVKSVLNIGVSNFSDVNLQELSNQSIELKNIIDELLTLEIFELVEEQVIDYAITNYVDNNEIIKKYVDVEELRKLKLVDFKRELGTIIETFGRLGKETELFNVEGLEDNTTGLNLYAFNSDVIRIINDNIEKSETVQQFMNKALEGVLVPTLFESQEDYYEMIDKEDFAWNEELDIFACILEEIEKNDGNFNLYELALSEEKNITLGMLKGLYATEKENSDSYYLDQSIFVCEVMTRIVSKQASKYELFEGLFDDPNLSYGKEIKVLVEMMIEAEIVENRNDYVIEFETLEQRFTSINEKMLNAFTNHIEDSTLLQKIITKSVRGQLSDDLVNDMEFWSETEGKWQSEMASLTRVIIDGEFTDENGEVKLDSISEEFNELGYTQLDAVYVNIDNSLILQDLLKITLKDSFVIPEDVLWSSEVKVIRDLVGSETYQYEVNGKMVWSKISLNELGELSSIRPETLELISYDIGDSKILKNALKDPLNEILDGESDPENWTNEEWKKELQSIAYVTKPLATRNLDKEFKGYPNNRVYIDINNISNSFNNEIRLDVLYNLLGNTSSNENGIKELFRNLFRFNKKEINNDFGINHSSILRKLFRDALETSINVDSTIDSNGAKYNVNFDEFTPVDYYNEVLALYNVIIGADLYVEKINEDDGHTYKYIVLDDISSKLTTITKPIILAITSQVSDSEILQKQMQKNLEESLGEEFTYNEMNLWDSSKWTIEMTALNSVVETLDENTDGSINLESMVHGNIIKLNTISAVSESYYSDIIRHVMKDNIDEMLVLENVHKRSCMPIYDTDGSLVYNGWDDNQWKYELETLEIICNEISADGETVNIEEIANNLHNIDMSFFSIIVDRVYGELDLASDIKYSSFILQAQLVEASESIMNSGDNITEDRIRKLYPLSYTGANWNEEANVPHYDLYDYKKDGKVGEWWQKELSAIEKIGLDKFGENGTIPADGIDFKNTKISTLNIIRDTIKYSYIVQSCMRSTAEDIMNQDIVVHPTYEVMSSEYWNGDIWYDEINAMRDVAKTLAIKNTNSSSLKVNTSLYTKRGLYQPSSWIIDETEDELYTFDLWGIDLESGTTSITIDTLYYVTEHAEDSNIVRTLIRPHIAEILGDKDDDSFVSEWLEDDGINDDVNEHVNRWDYEMEAFFEIMIEFAVDGRVELGETMFDKLPISIFDKLNGAFDNNDLIDDENIINDHGYVSDYNGNKYHSEVVRKLLINSLSSNSNINIESWKNNDNQWAYEIYAIGKIANEFAVDGFIDLTKISFENSNGDVEVKLSILDTVSSVINYSTYIQEKLNNSLFNDVNYQNVYPKIGFSETKNQWNDEISALYNVIKGTNYEVNGYFNPENLDFDGGIDYKILRNITKNISKSTYLQSKLERTIEDLVETDPTKIDTYLLDREDIGIEYNLDYDSANDVYVFDMKVNYGDLDGAWTTELSTIFEIVLDENSGLIHSDGTIVLDEVESKLNNLSIGLLSIASNKLDEYGHGTYGSSKIVRLNLIKPLELLANNDIGITRNDTDFKWVDSEDGLVQSDLHDLEDFFRILGVQTYGEALVKLFNYGETSKELTIEDKAQIVSLVYSSYYIGKVFSNHNISVN